MFGTRLPTSYRGLQSLLGRLNFCREFVPDYRRKIKPLIALLGKSGGNAWR